MDYVSTEKLAQLVVSAWGSFGFQQGLAAASVARIQQGILEDVRHLALCKTNIDEVMHCGGLWQGREIATYIPAHVFILRRDLIVRVTRDHLEAAVIGEAPKPIDFVRGFSGHRSEL